MRVVPVEAVVVREEGLEESAVCWHSGVRRTIAKLCTPWFCHRQENEWLEPKCVRTHATDETGREIEQEHSLTPSYFDGSLMSLP